MVGAYFQEGVFKANTGDEIMDCPRCAEKLKGVAKLKKHERIPIQRRYQGGVKTRIIGDTRPNTNEGRGMLPPNGMVIIDECKSCHRKSVMRYNLGNRTWIQEVYA